jgi:hypothetical protein
MVKVLGVLGVLRMCLNRFITFPPFGGAKISIFLVLVSSRRFAGGARFPSPTGARSWCRWSLCLVDPSGTLPVLALCPGAVPYLIRLIA